MSQAYIGTSGWQYKGWRDDFYPQNLQQKDWLRYYSRYFDTVEVNSSFYRQTQAQTFKKWQKETPKNFTFAIKGHRYITHVRLLKEESKESVEIFFKNTGALKGKHIVLWQLPPRFKKNVGRLKSFLKLLPKNYRHAFEFRDPSWVGKEVREIFEKSSIETAAVLQDWKDWPVLSEPWGKFVYLRFHGKDKLYTSNYSEEELKRKAKEIKRWLAKGLDVYAYFNNDAEGHAPVNAQRLRHLIARS